MQTTLHSSGYNLQLQVPRRLTTCEASKNCINNLAVVVVTWRDVRHTIACLHSLISSAMRPRFVVVVENGSDDETACGIDSFLAGAEAAEIYNPFQRLVSTIRATDYGKEYRYLGLNQSVELTALTGDANSTLVVLLSSPVNGGFASGNNIGIRYLEQAGFVGCVWMLNNDAYVVSDCIAALYHHSERHPLPILFGTLLVEYFDVNIVQAAGGQISPRFLSPNHLATGTARDALVNKQQIILADYPVGASMLTWTDQLYTRREPLFEGYFLYFEEPDLRATLGLVKCPIFLDAVVAHVGGAATGDEAMRGRTKRSFARDYYGTRARIVYGRRHARHNVPFVVLFCLALVVKRLLMFDFKAAGAVAKGSLNGICIKNNDF